MPNVFESTGSGGVTVQGSLIVKLLDPRGGFWCSKNRRLSFSQGQFVLGGNKSTYTTGIQNGAYVASITICNQDLKYKIKSNQVPDKVYGRRLIVETRSGCKISGRALFYKDISFSINGGLSASGLALITGGFDLVSSSGVLAGGTAYDEIIEGSEGFTPMFDGTYFLENAEPSGFPTGSNARSMLAWVRVPEYTTAQAIFGYGDEGDNGIIEFTYQDAEGPKACFFDTGSYSYRTLNPNTWYLMGAASDGSSARLYLCDDATHWVPVYPNWNTTLGKVRVGFGIGPEELTSLNNLFIGDVVGLGVWDRELTVEEVGDYFNAGRVTHSDLPSSLKTVNVTSTSNAQAKSRIITDLQSRSIIIDDLQAFGTSPYQAADFNGSSQIIISSAPTNANTISLWVNSPSGYQGAIITKGNNLWNSGVWDWGIWHDGSNTFYANAQAGGPIASYNYTYGAWYHLAIVRDNGSGESEFYVNGSLIGSGSASSANDFDNYIFIGGTENYFTGKIKEVQLFSTALSGTDVANLYNQGGPIHGSSGDTGLIAGYHLDGDAIDYSINANNGSWNGTEIYSQTEGIEDILTSNDLTLESLTGIIENIRTSDDSLLEIASIAINNIMTSAGEVLEFASLESEDSGLISFWNMTEESGTRYDSVSGNHLNYRTPTASFSFTSPIGRGNTTSFTDTSTLAFSWLWDFGDETTSTDQNPNHIYYSTGTYTVTLTINDSITVTHDITVEETVASYTSDSPQNFGNAITFTDTSTYATSWHWDFGDGNTSTEQNPSHTYSVAGTYTVTLQINGNISNTYHDVEVTLAQSYIWDKVDLSSYYNLIGFVSPGFNYTSLPNYGLDGYGVGDTWGAGGYSMNATAFGDSPKSLFDVEFDTPVASVGNDVFNTIRCTGQVIPLHGGQYTELRLLAFITNAPSRNVSFTITYSDSSTDTINQSISDWFYGYTNNFDNEEVAVIMDSRVSPSGTAVAASIFVYQYKLPINSNKNAVSITLPSTDFTYICSITQASLVTQPACWIKADSLVLNDGNSIATWNDRSGNSNNFTQSNASNKPIYHTDIVNGYPAVLFDGINDYMHNTLSAPNKYGVIAVYKQVTTGNFSVMISWGSGSSGKTFWSGYLLGTAYTGHLVTASDSSQGHRSYCVRVYFIRNYKIRPNYALKITRCKPN